MTYLLKLYNIERWNWQWQYFEISLVSVYISIPVIWEVMNEKLKKKQFFVNELCNTSLVQMKRTQRHERFFFQ